MLHNLKSNNDNKLAHTLTLSDVNRVGRSFPNALFCECVKGQMHKKAKFSKNTLVRVDKADDKVEESNFLSNLFVAMSTNEILLSCGCVAFRPAGLGHTPPSQVIFSS